MIRNVQDAFLSTRSDPDDLDDIGDVVGSHVDSILDI